MGTRRKFKKATLSFRVGMTGDECSYLLRRSRRWNLRSTNWVQKPRLSDRLGGIARWIVEDRSRGGVVHLIFARSRIKRDGPDGHASGPYTLVNMTRYEKEVQ